MTQVTITRSNAFPGLTDRVQHGDDSAIGVAVEASREAVGSIPRTNWTLGADVSNAWRALEGWVDAFERATHVPDYKLDEAREAVKSAITIANAEINAARQDQAGARKAIAELGRVPRVDGLADSLMDHEVRTIVREMTPKDRATLAEDLRRGLRPRVTLALARSPLPSELHTEAVAIYATTSEPHKRLALQSTIDSTDARTAAASAVADAAVSVRPIIDLFAAANEAREAASVRNQPRPIIQRAEQAMGPVATPAVRFVPDNTVRIEGSVVQHFKAAN